VIQAPPIAPTGEQFELLLGDQRATVVEVGGGLRTYSLGDRDVLDGYGVDELTPSDRGHVLLPWPNRIEGGTYEFDGRQHQLALTKPEEHNAIHGLVRWSAWTAAERERHRVVLEHILHAHPGYPFTLALRLEYTLTGQGLEVRTTATNVGDSACPYGAGAHPYLTLGTSTVDPLVLRLPARSVLESDERGLPVGIRKVDGTEYDFRESRPIGSTVLDNGFTDLERDEDGRARVELRDPDTGRSLTLWVDASYGYLMLFTGDPLPDVNRRSLAVEPMTCPPNAFGSGEALIRLEPGESTTGAWGIAVAA
jgi:aldose 1-epimerase